jgi:CheY-like chemotaxis protein
MKELLRETYSILIIEDEVSNVDALAVVLGHEGYRVFRADNRRRLNRLWITS